MPSLPPVPKARDLPPVPEPDGEPAKSRTGEAAPPALPVLPSDLPHSAPKVAEAIQEKLNSPAMTLSPELEKPEVKQTPASFVPRFIAFGIDCAILFTPILVLYILGALTIEIKGAWESIDHESRMQEWALLERNMDRLLWSMAIGFAWLYGAGLECSRWQGTVGKQWMGLKVTDAQGERISFLRATGRHAGKYLSALPCFLGFIFALFSSRGLAWHDRLADTRVVKR